MNIDAVRHYLKCNDAKLASLVAISLKEPDRSEGVKHVFDWYEDRYGDKYESFRLKGIKTVIGNFLDRIHVGSDLQIAKSLSEPHRSKELERMLDYYLNKKYIGSSLQIAKSLSEPAKSKGLERILCRCAEIGWTDDSKKILKLVFSSKDSKKILKLVFSSKSY